MKMKKKREKETGGMGDVYKEWKLFYCEKEKKSGEGWGGVRVDVNGEVTFFMKIQKKILWGGGGGGGGCQGGCELRSEAFVKIQKKKIFFFLGGGGERGQGGWERRIEAFVKIIFFFLGGGGVGSGGGGGGGGGGVARFWVGG